MRGLMAVPHSGVGLMVVVVLAAFTAAVAAETILYRWFTPAARTRRRIARAERRRFPAQRPAAPRFDRPTQKGEIR